MYRGKFEKGARGRRRKDGEGKREYKQDDRKFCVCWESELFAMAITRAKPLGFIRVVQL